jgi:filamentous hemagglutinin family protein
MLQTGMRGLIWAIAQSGVVAVALAIGLAEGAIAQIVPDDTLGAERSQVTSGTVGNRAVDRVAGGARRGSSLFHSFRSLNIDAGQRVYFNNPTGVRNILSRVTGNDVSNILGTLGVDGNANLFLLNPNGIVFGQDARLDLRGSFLATTADRFVFPNQITFGAVNPEAPPLLNVTVPIGLQYGRNPGAIASQARLAVDSGRSLVLAGGAINLDSSLLGVRFPEGGRIELGGVADAGKVSLTHQDNLFGLRFPSELGRADISISNSTLAAISSNKGEIAITGRSISIGNGSQIQAGISAGYGFRGSQAGDIRIDASQEVRVNQESLIADTVESATNTEPTAIGNAGNIYISTGSLLVRDRARLNASTSGRGDAGSVIIHARNLVMFEGSESAAFSSAGGISNGQVIAANGQGGDVRISTGSLLVRGGAQLIANTFGHGDAGSVVIHARDRVVFEGSGSAAFSSVGGSSSNGQAFAARGQGGDVRISTGSLLVRDGAQLVASTYGRGDAGSVVIQARDRMVFEGSGSAAFSSVGDSSVGEIFSNGREIAAAGGQGGDVQISTGSLLVRDGAALVASTYGRGDAGSVVIHARDRVMFEGRSSAFSSAGGISSNGQPIAASGQGGNVQISTGSLLVRDGAQLDASTYQQFQIQKR